MYQSLISSLVDRFSLPTEAGTQLESIIKSVVEDPFAPTSIVDPREVIDLHIADSLSILDLFKVSAVKVIADIGSGAGFPVLPLAVATPESTFFAVESVHRKCEFIRLTAERAKIRNLAVINSRAEGWKE